MGLSDRIESDSEARRKKEVSESSPRNASSTVCGSVPSVEVRVCVDTDELCRGKISRVGGDGLASAGLKARDVFDTKC